MTLILCLCSRVMCSAHCFTERNIWMKLNENHSKGSGDMEQTRNRKVNPMILKYDLDLESA